MLPTRTLCCLLFAATATAQWSQQVTANSPTSRTEAAMTFDLARGNTVLFGGAAVGAFTMRSDTWLFDGSNWTVAAPAVSPTGRLGANMVFDQARNVSVLYGGITSLISIALPNAHTWEWDGTNWSQAAPTVSPPGLAHYGLAYDSARQRVVLFGGSSNPGLLQTSNQTWEYDGTTWAQVITANNPGPRQYPGMCFHAALGRTVLFGGINPQTGGNNDTWTYDGANWSLVSLPTTPPAPRNFPKMVYDTARAVCVMYGGAIPSSGQPLNETWEFDGALWQQAQTPQPPQRTRFTMAYDILQQKIVMHGGVATNVGLLDTWEYGAFVSNLGAGCAGSNGVPVLTATNVPRIGTSFTTTLGNLANGAGIAALVAGFVALNPPTPLDVYGMPGCFAHTNADAVVFLPVIGGVMTAQISVPGSASLFGVTLHEQGLSLDAGVNAAGLVVSNAITATIGW